jgi:hypothetical protein
MFSPKREKGKGFKKLSPGDVNYPVLLTPIFYKLGVKGDEGEKPRRC